MALFVDKLKLKAAARSMPQFEVSVRTLFPGEVEDAVVEAATGFLYEQVANDVFDRRFAARLRKALLKMYRSAEPDEIAGRARRIARLAEMFQRTSEDDPDSPQAAFTQHVQCVIRSMLAEAGLPFNDPEHVKASLGQFDSTMRKIKSHLEGIKRQNHFVLK